MDRQTDWTGWKKINKEGRTDRGGPKKNDGRTDPQNMTQPNRKRRRMVSTPRNGRNREADRTGEFRDRWWCHRSKEDGVGGYGDGWRPLVNEDNEEDRNVLKRWTKRGEGGVVVQNFKESEKVRVCLKNHIEKG